MFPRLYYPSLYFPAYWPAVAETPSPSPVVPDVPLEDGFGAWERIPWTPKRKTAKTKPVPVGIDVRPATLVIVSRVVAPAVETSVEVQTTALRATRIVIDVEAQAMTLRSGFAFVLCSLSCDVQIEPSQPTAVGLISRRARFARLRAMEMALIDLGIDPDPESMAVVGALIPEREQPCSI